jgi:hypothetical protein
LAWKYPGEREIWSQKSPRLVSITDSEAKSQQSLRKFKVQAVRHNAAIHITIVG